MHNGCCVFTWSDATGVLEGELLPAAGDDSAAADKEPGEEAGIAFETPCRNLLQP